MLEQTGLAAFNESPQPALPEPSACGNDDAVNGGATTSITHDGTALVVQTSHDLLELPIWEKRLSAAKRRKLRRRVLKVLRLSAAHENEKTLKGGTKETKISKEKHFRELDRLWPPHEYTEAGRWFAIESGFKEDTKFVNDLIAVIQSRTFDHLAFPNAERTVRNMMMYELIRRACEECDVDMWIGSRCVTFSTSYDWLADQIAILLAEAKSRRLSEASDDKWDIVAANGYVYRDEPSIGFDRKAGYEVDVKRRGYPVVPNGQIDDMCALARHFDKHGRTPTLHSAIAHRLGLKSWAKVRAALLDFTYAGLIPYAKKYVRYDRYDHLKDPELVGRIYARLQPGLKRQHSGRTARIEKGMDDILHRGGDDAVTRKLSDQDWLRCPDCQVKPRASGAKERDGTDATRIECPKCNKTLVVIAAATLRNIRLGDVCEHCGEARNSHLSKRGAHVRCRSCGGENKRPRFQAAESPTPSQVENGSTSSPPAKNSS